MNIFEMQLSEVQLKNWLGVSIATTGLKPHCMVDETILVVKSLATKPDQLIPLHLTSFRARFGLVPEAFTSVDGADHEGYHNIRHERMTYIRNVSQLLLTNRCLVPATAYFNVVLNNGRAKAYRISLENQQPFLMAALWTTNKRPQIQLTSCGVVTQEVGEPSWQEFTDRIPVAFDFEGGCEWLRHKKRGKGIWKISKVLPISAFKVEALPTMPFSIAAHQLEKPRASIQSLSQ